MLLKSFKLPLNSALKINSSRIMTYSSLPFLISSKSIHQIPKAKFFNFSFKDLFSSGEDKAIELIKTGAKQYKDGTLDDAVASCKKAVKILRKSYGDDNAHLPILYNNISSIYYKQGNLTRALKYMKKSFDLGYEIHGPKHIPMAKIATNIGLLSMRMGQFN